jgi:hypothetical protein
MQVRSRTNLSDADQGDEDSFSPLQPVPSRPFVQLPNNHTCKRWSIRSGQAFIVHHYQYYAVKLGSEINLHISCAGNASSLFQSAIASSLGHGLRSRRFPDHQAPLSFQPCTITRFFQPHLKVPPIGVVLTSLFLGFSSSWLQCQGDISVILCKDGAFGQGGESRRETSSAFPV